MKEALKLQELQKKIGYSFRNTALLERALTHTSTASGIRRSWRGR